MNKLVTITEKSENKIIYNEPELLVSESAKLIRGNESRFCLDPLGGSIQNTLKIRKIISTNQCVFTDLDYSFENQMNMLQNITDNPGKKTEQHTFVLQEINKKIGGYKSQDKIKGLYNPDLFVDEKYVLQLLLGSHLDCFYCKKKTNVLYQKVREPTQWSLERIDNAFGHNKDNVEIACLLCNLSRKTMYHERFAFTKQMGNIIKLE